MRAAQVKASLGRMMPKILLPRLWQHGLLLTICVLVPLYTVYREVGVWMGGPQGVDFTTYYKAALDVRAGANPFGATIAWIHSYTPGSQIKGSYFVYTPFFALLLVPLTLLPLAAAATLWGVLNLASLAGATYACFRAVAVRPTALGVAGVVAAASLVGSVRKDLYFGQANIFILSLLCFMLWALLSRRSAWAGVLLAVACAIKPPLLILVAFFLWKREFRVICVAVVTFLALLLGPFVYLGGHVWHDQLTIWRFWSNMYVSYIDNESAKGLLARILDINPYIRPLVHAPELATALWLLLALTMALLTVVSVAPVRMARDLRSLLELGLVLTALLVVGPLTEYYYLTVLLLPLMTIGILLGAKARAPLRREKIFLGIVVLWMVFCLPLQNIEYFFSARMQASSLVVYIYAIAAAPLLYCLLVCFALQLWAILHITGRSVRSVVSDFVWNPVPHVSALLTDAYLAWSKADPASEG